MGNVLRERYEDTYKFKIAERDYGKAEGLLKYIERLMLKELKIKEKEINNYVYYFIKTNYTKIDILNAFKSYEKFDTFMKEIEYRLLQDEGFKKIL